MSVHTDCRVTTWIRNSNRTAIKVVDRPEPRQRQHKRERERARRYSQLKHPLNKLPHHRTPDRKTDQQDPFGSNKSKEDFATAEMKPICSALEKRNGVVVGAELACSVREENKADRESYSADWHSVSLKTQPQDRQTMNMNDDSRRETLSRQWLARTLKQTCPSGVFRVGTVERGVREHQLLPKRKSLPLPIFVPAELGIRLGRGAPHTEEDLQPFPTPDGACPSKRTVDEITRDLPPVKPTLMEFVKSPRDLGRSVSQEAQRG